MPFRYSFIFQVTTEPKNAAAATPHTGGWSEQLWSSSLVDPDGVSINKLARLRALCLPKQCALVGWKIAGFDIQGNKLIPTGSSVVKHRWPGASAYTVDVPQACLNLSGAGLGVRNKVRYTMRGFPDEAIENGEFTGSTGITNRVNDFAAEVINQSWKTVVRDLTQPTYRVFSIIAGVMVPISGAGLAQDDYVRLVHVKDINGDAVKGVFRISSITGTAMTLFNFPTTTTVKESGFVRKDTLAVVAYGSLNINRAGVKKIGAPLEGYRGRQSKS